MPMVIPNMHKIQIMVCNSLQSLVIKSGTLHTYMEMALHTSVRISNIKHNQNLSSSSSTEIWRWMGCHTWYFV